MHKLAAKANSAVFNEGQNVEDIVGDREADDDDGEIEDAAEEIPDGFLSNDEILNKHVDRILHEIWCWKRPLAASVDLR